MSASIAALVSPDVEPTVISQVRSRRSSGRRWTALPDQTGAHQPSFRYRGKKLIHCSISSGNSWWTS